VPSPRRAAGTCELLLTAAERLFAERGLDGVSLREIAAAAGQGNNSAVQYHFGSRDGLVRAVFERRFLQLDRRRGELLSSLDARGRGEDVPALVEVLVRPFAEELDGSSSHWVRFVARLHEDPRFNPFARTSPGRHGLPYAVPGEVTASTREVSNRIAARLHHLPREVVTERFFLVTTMVVHATADREALVFRRAGADLEPAERFLGSLVEASVAILTAPRAHPRRAGAGARETRPGALAGSRQRRR
jgi:AcrR family transcriptional regulator